MNEDRKIMLCLMGLYAHTIIHGVIMGELVRNGYDYIAIPLFIFGQLYFVFGMIRSLPTD